MTLTTVLSYDDGMQRRLCVLFGLLLISGCHKEPAYKPATMKPGPIQAWANRAPKQTASDDRAGKDYAKLSNDFAFKFFTAVDSPGKNAFVSPMSVTMALSMLANGARGRTQDLILKSLGETGGVKSLNAGARNMMVVLHSGKDCPVTFANAVWTMAGYPPEPTFVSAMGDNYAAQVQTNLPIGQAGADQVNKWASDMTSGLVDHAIDPIDGQTHSVLDNAAAFADNWASQFDPRKTKQGLFVKADGSETQVPLMSQEHLQCLYGEADKATCVELAYKSSDFAMVMVSPNHDSTDTPEAFLAKQTAASWKSMLDDLNETPTTIELPRMTFREQMDLKKALPGLGLGDLLNRTDMSGISPKLEGDFLSKAVQNTFLQVDEHGTTAAANTQLDTAGGGFEFAGTRPFAFAIIHKPTGAILFLGVCNDPSALQ